MASQLQPVVAGGDPAGRGRSHRISGLTSWAREFADLYFAGTTCVFVLHGNVHDLIRQGPADDPVRRHSRIPGDATLRNPGTSCYDTT